MTDVSDLSGREIDGFRILDRIGSGASGVVYLAASNGDRPYAPAGRPLALKFYRPEIMTQKGQSERIRREVAAGGLAHPSLATVFEARGIEGKLPFIVMAYVDGMPLTRWVTSYHPIASNLVVQLMLALARGVELLHSKDLVHRDIKPANVLITPSFEAVLMDFGVVRAPAPDTPTRSDQFVGTIRNASPELLRGQTFDHRTDIYSLGTVLFALLCGEEVFAHETQFVRLSELVKAGTPSFAQCNQEAKPARELVALCSKMLETDVGKRPTTVAAVIEELESIRTTSLPAHDDAARHGYVATALTGLDKDSRGYITFASAKIAEIARTQGIYVYQPRRATDPLLNPDVSPAEVYTLDRRRVVGADVVFVLLNKPSFGVGQEIEIASSYGKPVVLIREEGTVVSRMVLGAPAHIVSDISYSSPEDLERKLRDSLPRIRQKIEGWRNGVGDATRFAILADAVTSRRVSQGYATAATLADAIGVSVTLIEALERGALENVGIQVLMRVADALKCEVGDLVRRDVRAEPTEAEGQSIRALESVANRQLWTARDFFQLRTAFLHEKAASASKEVVTEPMWIARKRALEDERGRGVQQELDVS